MPRDEHARIQAMKDTRILGTSYDHYLQNAQQLSSYGSAQAGDAGLGRSVGGEVYGFRGGNASLSYQDPVILTGPGFRSLGPQDMVANSSLPAGFRSHVPVDPMVRPVLPEREIPLPHDASNTLFVEGLPRDATEREIAHIFRPFRGYKEVRVVKKEPKYGWWIPRSSLFCGFHYSIICHDCYECCGRIQDGPSRPRLMGSASAVCEVPWSETWPWLPWQEIDEINLLLQLPFFLFLEAAAVPFPIDERSRVPASKGYFSSS
ncbi:hypothetical protein MA16_Dca010184 [Dendrobium catenatum]|uniref:RRM domain-containing protein n=1 Tax=Dendrobium catenatum TaxID=906689 RepID=A0A2I0WAD4_9ASPA|nr:hypothetical protein MA16_Dca010184 [Dendrobium catenatum]